MTRCALYRHFDANGVLLYCGVTANPPARLAAHASGSAWFMDLASSTYEWHPDRASAIAAETRAILEEEPLHNARASADAPRGRRGANQPGATPLALWMVKTGTTQDEVAARIGVKQGSVSKLARGLMRPSIATAIAIERLTDGAVPASSWKATDPA